MTLRGSDTGTPWAEPENAGRGAVFTTFLVINVQ